MDERTDKHHADHAAVCLHHQSLVDREDDVYMREMAVDLGDTESDRKTILYCCQICPIHCF